MKVRFKINWRCYPRGEILEDMADGMATELCRRGICERLTSPVVAPSHEVEMREPAVERAVKRPASASRR